MNQIAKFDPEKSAKELKNKLQSFNKMTVEIVEELFRARKFYSKSGYRTDLVSSDTRLTTFEKYLEYVGVAKPTAYRWLERYVPEQNKLLTHEEFQQKKQIEIQEKMSAEEKQRMLLSHFRKTGEKLNGWSKSLDEIARRENEEAAKRERRAQETITQMKKEQEEKERNKNNSNIINEALRFATDNVIREIGKRQTWKEKIRLSDSGKEDAFMDAIIDYLETLADDNRRIEACNNIIKICRNISVELQKVKSA